jgi:tRNA G18 (ribose-2'-O)-methylase SpoU
VRIKWRERQRRIQASLGETWNIAGRTPEDPGLREAYNDLPGAPIRLITLPLSKDVNHGGLLRTADAFRLERVDFSREEDRANDFSGHRGTAGWQPYRWIEPEEAITEAIAEGYTLCALTLSERAVSIDEVEWKFPLAIILGAENWGIPPEIEDRCELVAAIPLYGLVTSLNVATAAALAVHAAVTAYAKANPDFQPARTTSRRLLNLPPVTFEDPNEP